MHRMKCRIPIKQKIKQINWKQKAYGRSFRTGYDCASCNRCKDKICSFENTSLPTAHSWQNSFTRPFTTWTRRIIRKSNWMRGRPAKWIHRHGTSLSGRTGRSLRQEAARLSALGTWMRPAIWTGCMSIRTIRGKVLHLRSATNWSASRLERHSRHTLPSRQSCFSSIADTMSCANRKWSVTALRSRILWWKNSQKGQNNDEYSWPECGLSEWIQDLLLHQERRHCAEYHVRWLHLLWRCGRSDGVWY